MAADESVPRGWGKQFPRVTNDEYLALARARLSSLQYGIVLFLITQTRGTGRFQSGELSGYDDVDEARDHFGCESRHLFRAQVAGRLGRHPNAVARELRRLIAAGIVVELEPAQKRQAAELAVELDERRWCLERLAAGGGAPRVARTVGATVRPTVPPTQVTRGTVNGPVQARAESMNRSVPPSAGTVNRPVPSSGECVNEPVHLLGDLGERPPREREKKERRPTAVQRADGARTSVLRRKRSRSHSCAHWPRASRQPGGGRAERPRERRAPRFLAPLEGTILCIPFGIDGYCAHAPGRHVV